jgi:hypothetical protein
MNANPTRDSGACAAQPAGASFAPDRARDVGADDLPDYLKIASILLRATFVVALVVVAARVSAPQVPGTGWFDMPTGDIARVTLGALFCLCMLRQIFRFPKDAGAHRTWLYLGLALAPLSLICLVAVW